MSRILSPSEINCFTDCRVKWDFAYRQHIRFDKYKRAACIGSAVHAGLAGWYAREPLNDCYKALVAKASKYDMPVEDLAVAKGIFEHYIVFYATDLDLYEPLIIETKITESSVGLKAIPDLVLIEKATGIHFIIDHKVITNLEIDKTFDTQKIALFKVLGKRYPIGGIIFNLIRSKLPIIPEPIKNNTRLKKFTPASTTESVFKKALSMYNFQASDYPEAVEYFETHENSFFKRVPVEITTEEIEDFDDRFDLIQEEIAGGIIYANRQWDCERSCDYYEMCHTLEDKESKLVLEKKSLIE